MNCFTFIGLGVSCFSAAGGVFFLLTISIIEANVIGFKLFDLKVEYLNLHTASGVSFL